MKEKNCDQKDRKILLGFCYYDILCSYEMRQYFEYIPREFNAI